MFTIILMECEFAFKLSRMLTSVPNSELMYTFPYEFLLI